MKENRYHPFARSVNLKKSAHMNDKSWRYDLYHNHLFTNNICQLLPRFCVCFMHFWPSTLYRNITVSVPPLIHSTGRRDPSKAQIRLRTSISKFINCFLFICTYNKEFTFTPLHTSSKVFCIPPTPFPNRGPDIAYSIRRPTISRLGIVGRRSHSVPTPEKHGN